MIPIYLMGLDSSSDSHLNTCSFDNHMKKQRHLSKFSQTPVSQLVIRHNDLRNLNIYPQYHTAVSKITQNERYYCVPTSCNYSRFFMVIKIEKNPYKKICMRKKNRRCKRERSKDLKKKKKSRENGNYNIKNIIYKELQSYRMVAGVASSLSWMTVTQFRKRIFILSARRVIGL